MPLLCAQTFTIKGVLGGTPSPALPGLTPRSLKQDSVNLLSTPSPPRETGLTLKPAYL